MNKDTFRFQLVNAEGCLMAVVDTTSFYAARKHFNESYYGKYTIMCGNDYRNVILK